MVIEPPSATVPIEAWGTGERVMPRDISTDNLERAHGRGVFRERDNDEKKSGDFVAIRGKCLNAVGKFPTVRGGEWR